MDSPGDWTATALFSPSKARAQQVQARDWASVDSWLSKQYGKRLPAFERNEETLQALLTLATLNEDADEQRGLIEKVERLALQAQTKRRHEGEDVYHSLLDSLDRGDHETLDALAGSALLLDTSDYALMAGRLCELTAQRFELVEQVHRAEAQHIAVKSEQIRLGQLLEALGVEHFQPPGNVLEQSAEWARSTKQLKAKLAEYDERLSAVRSTAVPSPTLEHLARERRELDALRGKLQMLNTDLSAFDSLPSDPKTARAKLERARTDLRGLTAQRDKLFESLADND